MKPPQQSIRFVDENTAGKNDSSGGLIEESHLRPRNRILGVKDRLYIIRSVPKLLLLVVSEYDTPSVTSGITS